MNWRPAPLSVASVSGMTLVVLAIVALTGCPRNVQYGQKSRPTNVQRTGVAGLSGVEAKLDQIDEWNRQASSESIATELNEWIRNARPAPGWKRDPLIDQLPEEFVQLGPIKAVGGTKFDPSDVSFLVERRLVHATSERIVASGVCEGCDLFLEEGPLKDDAAASKNAAGSSSRLETTPAEKVDFLFDWTIRNIVLQPMPPSPPVPGDEVVGSGLAVWRGMPGPGYSLPMDQILLRGQGDAWMRLRVFLALCEQQGLRAVALGTPSGNRAEPQWPRLAGVLVDDELLLYDLALGLPVPDGAGGTASFEEFRADPSKWKSAIETAFGDEPRPREYRFIEPDKLVAYVAADPASLSRRMATLEQEWTGAGRVRLTVQPSAIAERLKEVAGIEKTEIWNLPIESLIFEGMIGEMARRGDQGVADYLRERQIFSPPTPIFLARKRYLVGPPTGEEDPQTATEILLNATLTEEQLDEIETSRRVQELLGYDKILKQIPDEQQKRQFLRQAREQFGSIKKLARYYVGFALYQNGDFENAVRRFETAAEQSDDGLWRTGSYYNLGRSLEAEGRQSAAVSLYRQDKSLQQPMSRLRAAKLAERAGIANAAAPAGEETAPAEEAAPAAEPDPATPPSEDKAPEASTPEATDAEPAADPATPAPENE